MSQRRTEAACVHQSQLFLSGRSYDDARQQSGLPATATDDTKPHINRVPSPKQTIRATWSSRMLGDWTALWRHEGHTTTLQGVWLDPFTDYDGAGYRSNPTSCPAGCDNCPDYTNPTQEDRDGDGYGDACDNCPDGEGRGGGVSFQGGRGTGRGWGTGMGMGIVHTGISPCAVFASPSIPLPRPRFQFPHPPSSSPSPTSIRN
jgi:hypothetical protein